MIISFLLVWVINPYVNTFVREYTPVYNIVQSNCQELVMEQTGSQKALDKEEQTQIMEKMELPDILKTSLMEIILQRHTAILQSVRLRNI